MYLTWTLLLLTKVLQWAEDFHVYLTSYLFFAPDSSLECCALAQGKGTDGEIDELWGCTWSGESVHGPFVHFTFF